MDAQCTRQLVSHYFTPLVVVHAVASIALAAVATWNGFLSLRTLRGRPHRLEQQRRNATAMFWTFLLTFGLGLLLYPAFVGARQGGLEAKAPQLLALFKVKEHWLGLALGMLLYYVPASRRLLDTGAGPSRLFLATGVVLMLVIWEAAFIGLSATAGHG